MPAIIFPQFKPLSVTGQYEVKTESYTLTHLNKIETYNDKGENRKISIQFWYPETKNDNEKKKLLLRLSTTLHDEIARWQKMSSAQLMDKLNIYLLNA